jgi:D-alanine-D-alanine ligase
MENIAILAGGYSGEKVVSLESAKFVKNNLNPQKYKAFIILIERKSWKYINDDGSEFPIDKNDFSLMLDNQKITFDKVYNIIHGDPGENGKMQAYFEMLDISHTSCDSITSALTFNKFFTNKVVGGLGVKIAKSFHLYKSENYNIDKIIERTSLPCFVKPNRGGSSIGMTKVTEKQQLEEAIQIAFQEDTEVLIEEFIDGTELTCGLLKHKGEMIVLPLCLIDSKKEFFDFEAKYDASLADELIPAPIEVELEKQVKATSVYVYNQLNCSGVVRADYIFNKNGLYFLEINTIPGLAANSIVPKMARSFGWSNSELLDKVLNCSDY